MADPTAIEQILAFFAVVQDPRRQHATTWHSLETIITITILATICGAQHWVEIAHFAVDRPGQFLTGRLLRLGRPQPRTAAEHHAARGGGRRPLHEPSACGHVLSLFVRRQ